MTERMIRPLRLNGTYYQTPPITDRSIVPKSSLKSGWGTEVGFYAP